MISIISLMDWVRGWPAEHSRVSQKPERRFRPIMNLLEGNRKDVRCSLSVFRGGFTLSAVNKIAGATPALFIVLVDKAIVRTDRPTDT
jgi:hypothetical protein